jgi:hypothetical protein
VRIYPKDRKLAKAFNTMCQVNNIHQPRYIPSGRTISEAKELDREARKGGKKSEEAIAKRTATRKKKGNYIRTKESIQKGIETRKKKNSYVGRIFTEEHRENLAKKKRRVVIRLTLDGTVVETHISVSEAAKTLNISISGISRVLTGKVPNYRGFIWKYN